MSGYVGYRASTDFVKRHEKEIITSFYLTKARVPSYGTIRRVIMGVNYEELILAFNNWGRQYINNSELEWIAVDGKALRNTVTNCDNNDNNSHNFSTLVSFFSIKKGIVVNVDKFDNQRASEIDTVKNLIKALDLTNVVLTLDAIHCQTESVNKILSSGADYIIPVKKNQP